VHAYVLIPLIPTLIDHRDSGLYHYRKLRRSLVPLDSAERGFL